MNNFFENMPDSTVTSDRILYTPSAFAKTSLFYLQEIGTLTANRAHTSRRTNLDSYLFFVVLSGGGQLVYDGVCYELSGGDCVFIDCTKPYSHTTDPAHLWTLSWIHFYGGTLSAIYGKYVTRGGQPVFHPAECEHFIQQHQSIFQTAASDDHTRDMKLNSELAFLLALLMAESWNPEQMDGKRKKSSMFSVKQYLDEHYNEKIVLDELAERFYINKYYLTRIFKEQYGSSIHAYLRQVRITKAKQMLRFTSEKVETIGRKCGIGEANYFCRIFKKVEGVTPSEYRDKW